MLSCGAKSNDMVKIIKTDTATGISEEQKADITQRLMDFNDRNHVTYFGMDHYPNEKLEYYSSMQDTILLIQQLIDFIKNEGYEITAKEPREKSNNGISCGIVYGSRLQCYNEGLKNIVIYKNDTPEEIYKYLLGIKETIIAKNKYLEKLKPNPIFEHLKF
jgi:hypothetical protein